MAPQTSTDDPQPEQTEHARLREKLRDRYRIGGEYVGAPTVAVILGVGRTTVHDQVKQRRFVIPHRLAARKPLFLLDDLVAWMLGREWPRDPQPAAPAAARRRRQEEPTAVFKHADAHAAFMLMCEKRGLSPTGAAPRGEA